MCELFAISSLLPTRVSFSMAEFSQHGGLTGCHKDGWGIAFYEENDVQIIRETIPAIDSDYIHCLQDHNFSSNLIISHIRLATQGKIQLKNTQPFCRELAGKMHVFAHNGNFKSIETSKTIKLGRYRPLGETDSEYAFCFLMNLMEDLWNSEKLPDLEARLEVVSYFADIIRKLGPANFIYSDSEILFVHGHRRTQKDNRGILPPGLFTLCRTCSAKKERTKIKGLDLDFRSEKQEVLLAASVPLTKEKWIPLAEGEI
ncbi:class II glutamine amidotransferase [Pleurocapsales cyanobacterium LEGE 10410]|nr:class II glutamine amidotransferase [Pleurocapsales cyanobacterium LEGE 10410]